MANRDRLLEREIRIAGMLRPLGKKPMPRTQAELAGKLLDLHPTSDEAASLYEKQVRGHFFGPPPSRPKYA